MKTGKYIISFFAIMICQYLYSCQINTDEKDIHWAHVTYDIPFGAEFDKSDSITIPHSVYLKYEKFLDSIYLLSSLKQELNLPKEECFQKTYFAIPINPNVLIFVMYYTDRPFNYYERFLFISYDLKSKQYSHKPLDLNAFSIADGEVKFEPEYRLITPPVFRFNKERNMIIVKQRRHNGNIYNAIEEHWVKVCPDMSLLPSFKVETLAYMPFDESNKKIVRKLDDNSLLHVTLIDNINNFVSEIGKATLCRNKAGQYEWKNIQLVDSGYKDVLFSCDISNH